MLGVLGVLSAVGALGALVALGVLGALGVQSSTQVEVCLQPTVLLARSQRSGSKPTAGLKANTTPRDGRQTKPNKRKQQTTQGFCFCNSHSVFKRKFCYFLILLALICAQPCFVYSRVCLFPFLVGFISSKKGGRNMVLPTTSFVVGNRLWERPIWNEILPNVTIGSVPIVLPDPWHCLGSEKKYMGSYCIHANLECPCTLR